MQNQSKQKGFTETRGRLMGVLSINITCTASPNKNKSDLFFGKFEASPNNFLAFGMKTPIYYNLQL